MPSQQRERRIKRAFDASAKRKTMPVEMQTEDPFDVSYKKNSRLILASKRVGKVRQCQLSRLMSSCYELGPLWCWYGGGTK